MQLVYKNETIKHIKKINPKDLQKVKKKITNLIKNPLLGKPLHGELEWLYSLKAWPLRIIYTLNTRTQVIEIITIDYRGSVYH